MTKGKPWSRDEESELIRLLKAGEDLQSVAGRMGKTLDSIKHKARRLGLIEGPSVGAGPSSSSSEGLLPKDWPTVEEAVGVLGAAMRAATKPGVSRAEVEKLKGVADLAWKYKIGAADLINYKKLERDYVELSRKYEELAAKSANLSAR